MSAAPALTPMDRPSWNRFVASIRHPQLRDVVACLGATPLIQAKDPKPGLVQWCPWPDPWLSPISCAKIQEWDARVDPSTELVPNEMRFRLGRYVELVMQWTCTHILGHELLASNFRLRASAQDGIVRDIGELDLVYRDSFRRTTIHRECAIKFYLYDPRVHSHSDSGDFDVMLAACVGPQRKDSLHRKLLRMRNHQGPIAHQAQARAQLLQAGIDIQSTELWLRGQLYFPHPITGLSSPPSVFTKGVHDPGFNPDASQDATWCFSRHREQLFRSADKHTRWLCLEKPAWCSPIHGTDVDGTMAPKWTAFADFTAPAADRPQLFAKCRNFDGAWHELHRVFVVPDNWS